MSRSYRKPVFVDGYKRKSDSKWFFKRLSNRMARKDWTLPDGNAYRKNRLVYVICDYRFFVSKNDEWYKKVIRK